MKQYIFLGALLISGVAFSQVGVNTSNPQGIFNIDGGRDNPTTGSAHTQAQQLNDFTVLANGNTGIGTIVPDTKLHIVTGGTALSPNPTGFKLVDGNQNTDYVLTSDNTGVGTWKPSGTTSYKMGVHVANTLNIPFEQVPNSGNYWLSTGSYITLPAGTWRIEVTELLGGYTNNGTFLTADDWMWFRFSLSSRTDAATVGQVSGTLSTILTPDFVTIDPTTGNQLMGSPQYVSTNYDGPRIASPTRFAVANGTFLVKNSVQTTYYLIANPYNATSTKTGFYFRNVGSRTWGENRIIASAINLTN